MPRLATLRNNPRLLIVAPFSTTAIASEHLNPAYQLTLDLSVSSGIDTCLNPLTRLNINDQAMSQTMGIRIVFTGILQGRYGCIRQIWNMSKRDPLPASL